MDGNVNSGQLSDVQTFQTYILVCARVFLSYHRVFRRNCHSLTNLTNLPFKIGKDKFFYLGISCNSYMIPWKVSIAMGDIKIIWRGWESSYCTDTKTITGSVTLPNLSVINKNTWMSFVGMGKLTYYYPVNTI